MGTDKLLQHLMLLWYRTLHTELAVPEKGSPIELFERVCLDGFDWQPTTLFARKRGDKFDSRANLGTFERERERRKLPMHQST